MDPKAADNTIVCARCASPDLMFVAKEVLDPGEIQRTHAICFACDNLFPC